MELILQGFVTVLQPGVLLVLIAGTLGGIVIGALPGLTATMGVALLTPLTFSMPPTTGLVMLCGIYCGAIYGGSISAILINTPGTPAAAATVFDGYALTKKGLAGKALGISAIASFCGGLFSALCLTFIAPQLARVALSFTSPEYFAMGCMGLSIVASISGEYVLRGLISACLGLVLGMVGIDAINGAMRYTLDTVNLLNGVSFIPVLIGLFAVAEVLRTTESMLKSAHVEVHLSGVLPTLAELRGCARAMLKGSVIGTLVGIVPATGGDIAAFISYGEAKRSSKDGDQFGTGVLEGVAAPESANNGATGGALIPLMTLGIPGDAVTAIFLGALMLQGLRPGPMLFKDHADVVYAVFAGMIMANVIFLLFGLFAIKYLARVVNVPKPILTPIIFVLCIVGSYAINNNLFDLWIMMLFGVIGYLLEKFRFPVSPIVLGLILGPMVESEFRRSLLLSQGDYSIFYARPITMLILALTLFSVIAAYVQQRRRKQRPRPGSMGVDSAS